MSEHLGLDQLADALAGEAAPGPHLSGCEECHAALARLEQALPAVSAALAGLPVPAQPADLDERLARALRPSPVADLQLHRASRWRKPLAAVSGLAAVAALVFGGIQVLGAGKGGPADQTTATSAQHPTRTSSTGSAYRRDGKLLARELPALLVGAATADSAAGPAPRAETKGLQPGSTTFMARQDALARLRTTAGLASCITSLTEPDQVVLPLALDYATFEGSPALVVVLPSPKPNKVDVFVVGPGCTASDAALLYFARLDKP